MWINKYCIHIFVERKSRIGNKMDRKREKERDRVSEFEVLKRGLEARVLRTQCIYNRSSSHPSSNFFKDTFAHTHTYNTMIIFNRFVKHSTSNSDTPPKHSNDNDDGGGGDSNSNGSHGVDGIKKSTHTPHHIHITKRVHRRNFCS